MRLMDAGLAPLQSTRCLSSSRGSKPVFLLIQGADGFEYHDKAEYLGHRARAIATEAVAEDWQNEKNSSSKWRSPAILMIHFWGQVRRCLLERQVSWSVSTSIQHAAQTLK